MEHIMSRKNVGFVGACAAAFFALFSRVLEVENENGTESESFFGLNEYDLLSVICTLMVIACVAFATKNAHPLGAMHTH